MSDQDHLSAEYMQKKAVSLLSRCGALTARLQAMMRLLPSLVTPEQLAEMIAGLASAEDASSLLQATHTAFAAQIKSKITPDALQQACEPLATGGSTVSYMRNLLREARMFAEEHTEAARQRQHRAMELALLESGWTEDGQGGFMPPSRPIAARSARRPGSGVRAMPTDDSCRPSSAHPLPSIVEQLMRGGDDGADGMDEISAMRLALAHLEATAPTEWHLSRNMRFLKDRAGAMDMRHAALQDELAALTDHFEQLEAKKQSLMLKLGLKAGEDVEGGSAPHSRAASRPGSSHGTTLASTAPPQEATELKYIREQLATLKRHANAHTASTSEDAPAGAAHHRVLSLSHSLVEDISNDMREAQRLQELYARNDADLKRLCMRKGIDLDMVREEFDEEMVDDEPLGDAMEGHGEAPAWKEEVVPGSKAFHIGLQARRFPVRFARDGSGRLLHANRPLSATRMLGLHQGAEASDQNVLHGGNLDEVKLVGEAATLRWCAEQLKVLRQRMDARFASLYAHVDAARTEVAAMTTRREHGEDKFLRDRVREVAAAISTRSHELDAYREQVVERLRAAATRTAEWEGRSARYANAHRQALVLLQRVGCSPIIKADVP